jgi:phosphate transport system permease protein
MSTSGDALHDYEAEANALLLAEWEPWVDQDLGLLPSGETYRDEPRRIRHTGMADAVLLFGSLFGAGALGLTLCRFLSWHGIMAPTLVVAVLFASVYSAVIRTSAGGEAATDRLIHVFVVLGAVVAVLPLLSLVAYIAVKGSRQLRPGFFVSDMAKVGPLDNGGGARHAIVGSVEQVGIASSVAVPIGTMSAVYLNELKGRMATVVRFTVDAMSGVPSIVAGLFIYAFWIIQLRRGPSGLAGSLALIVLMLPTITRTAEEVLRTIADSLREASLALGATLWRTVVGVVLPTARSGLTTAVLLGVARAVGETAPVLLTAKGAPNTNLNPFSGPQSNLPLFVYQLIGQPNQRQKDRAYTGALVLLVLVVVLFTLARMAGTSRRRR